MNSDWGPPPVKPVLEPRTVVRLHAKLRQLLRLKYGARRARLLRSIRECFSEILGQEVGGRTVILRFGAFREKAHADDPVNAVVEEKAGLLFGVDKCESSDCVQRSRGLGAPHILDERSPGVEAWSLRGSRQYKTPTFVSAGTEVSTASKSAEAPPSKVHLSSREFRSMTVYAKLFLDLQRKVARLDTDRRRDSSKKEKARLTLVIAGIEKEIQETADLLFQQFQDMLIPDTIPITSYKKADWDDAIEEAFGSLQAVGSGRFRLGGIDEDIREPDIANVIFSLYLARKVFCPKGEAEIPVAVEKFAERVLRPAPEHPGRGEALGIFKLLASTLFDSESLAFFKETADLPTHASGCAERSRSEGGKRDAYYAIEKNFVDEVKPVGISTGGKIRVITTDSARNLDYAYLNGYMASRVRSCRWSVFGRTVGEWMKNREFRTWIVSGDLESATDLFSGEFAEAAIDRLVEIDPDLDDEDGWRMKRFTTRAVLSFEDAALLMNLKQDPVMYDLIQKRGQLMGSILSFPILCLVSLTAFLYTRPDLVRSVRSGGLEALRNIDCVGVNGDDVVFEAEDRGAKWVEGVEAVGGKVSRGKSLCNRSAFTVNSELWTRNSDGSWHPPCEIRPSLWTGILAGRKASPDLMWQRLIDSQFPLSYEMRELIVKRWKLRLPSSLGGVGLLREYRPYEVFAARLEKEAMPRKTRVVAPDACKNIIPVPCRKAWVPKEWCKHLLEQKTRREGIEGIAVWQEKDKGSFDRCAHNLEVKRQWRVVTRDELAGQRSAYYHEFDMKERGYSKALIPTDITWTVKQEKQVQTYPHTGARAYPDDLGVEQWWEDQPGEDERYETRSLWPNYRGDETKAEETAERGKGHWVTRWESDGSLLSSKRWSEPQL